MGDSFLGWPVDGIGRLGAKGPLLCTRVVAMERGVEAAMRGELLATAAKERRGEIVLEEGGVARVEEGVEGT